MKISFFSSLPMRTKISDIILAVYGTSDNADITNVSNVKSRVLKNRIFQLHYFVRRYPKIAADSYDSIQMLLERKYVNEEFKRRREELQITENENISPFDPKDHTRRSVESNEEPFLNLNRKLI